MIRYKHLLVRALDHGGENSQTYAELADKIGIPTPSLHNYVNRQTLARVENIHKIADYFGEDIGSLYSEDDDETALLVKRVRSLPQKRKAALLRELGE